MNFLNSQYMQLAIDEAWRYQLLTYPNPAVGAVIVKKGKVLSVQAHKEAGSPHAEVLALKEAYLEYYPNSSLQSLNDSKEIHQYLCNNHNDFFQDCEIYVTLEPCNHTGKTPPCSLLLEAVKIAKVFIGILDPNKNAAGGAQYLKQKGIFVEVGICEKEAQKLLNPFILWQQKNFIFFKLAMRLDGTIDNGYITTQESLKYVHKLRSKIDLLVIGGNTVRIDRPTLDTRFASSQNPPDLLIFSKEKKFDQSIPLFRVKKREVIISEELTLLEKKHFIMVEGGYNLLKKLQKEIDYLIVFVSHKKVMQKPFDIQTLGYEKVYSFWINQYDELIFLK